MACSCKVCLDDSKCLLYHMLATAVAQCWMLPALISSLLATGFSLATALTQSWIHIKCVTGEKVQIGIADTCFINKTATVTEETVCEATKGDAGWLHSVAFLIYTSVALTILCTLVTSLLLCTPAKGNASGVSMAVAGISFVPAVLLIIALMSIIPVEAHKETLDKTLHVIQQTFHFNCTPIARMSGVRTGQSSAYCGISAAFMLCGTIWSFVMACVTRNHFKQDDSNGKVEASTKLIWKRGHSQAQRRAQSRDLEVVWNDRFFTKTNLSPSPVIGRKNSTFVNDSILNMFGQ